MLARLPLAVAVCVALQFPAQAQDAPEDADAVADEPAEALAA